MTKISIEMEEDHVRFLTALAKEMMENWQSFSSKEDFIKSKLEDGYTQEEALKLAEDLEEYSQHEKGL
jgi:hypothetical protein